jgi:hypothetical protein
MMFLSEQPLQASLLIFSLMKEKIDLNEILIASITPYFLEKQYFVVSLSLASLERSFHSLRYTP